MRKRETSWTDLIVALTVMCGALVYYWWLRDECAHRGGVLVRTAFGSDCVAPLKRLPPEER